MKIEKYFWNLNPKALKETKKILQNPFHPQFESKIITLLSRCDRPKEVFALLGRDKFIESWPKIRRAWNRMGQYTDFKAWWETIYEQLLSRKTVKAGPEGNEPSILRTIGLLLKNERNKLGLSQSDLSQRVHVNQPDLSDIERGRKNITMLTFFRLCKALNMKDISIKIQN